MRSYGLNEQVESVDSGRDALELSPTAGGADDAQDPAKDMLDMPPPTVEDSPEHIKPSRTPPRSPSNNSAADQGVGGVMNKENEGYRGDLTLETPILMRETSELARSDPDEDEDEVEDVDGAALDIGNIRRDEDFAYRTTTLVDDDTTSMTLQAFTTGLYAPKPSH
ncbi:uncharacterized protein N7484_000577 [Penicillium longicatenatum]|uniref:uncharacterized protein n=1 Tax=Penicillium longicatenatum TaxID=1561947 RepID=UPI0025479FA0|nr:uncharacterized protein N7484_000577 [Penicillium longicatenatum]KAJ5661205.1 hypothetical protein N7484_000577 [Penicillium longicatenatum]